MVLLGNIIDREQGKVWCRESFMRFNCFNVITTIDTGSLAFVLIKFNNYSHFPLFNLLQLFKYKRECGNYLK